LIARPALPQAIPTDDTFPTLAAETKRRHLHSNGMPVQAPIFDSNGAPINAPITAGPGAITIHAESGRLYSLETPDKVSVKAFKHDGPGATNVDF